MEGFAGALANIKILFITLCLFMATSLPAYAQDITTGLVGHWKLDETTGTDAIDYASVNNGTMVGGLDAGTDSVAGKVGTALDFDGVNDWITIPDFAMSGSNGLSISAWVYNRTVSYDPRMISKNDGANTTNHDWSFYLDDSAGTLRLTTRLRTVNGYHQFISNILMPLNEWHHMLMTYDETTDLISFYLDGDLVTTNVHPSGGAIHSGNPGREIRIGDSGSGGREWDGFIDDVRIYDRALTTADIAELYRSRNGHIDYNTDSRTMEYFNGDEWIGMGKQPYIPNAVEFDGTNDYLARGSALTGVSDSKQWTGSFWIKSNDTTSYHRIQESVNFDTHIEWHQDSTDTIVISAQNSTDTEVLYIETSALNDIDWHHILFSVDLSDTNKRHLYVDGASDLNVSTYVDDFIDFTEVDFAVGAGPSGLGKSSADMADFWLDTGTYIDFSIPGNRAKFYNNGPVDLGADGSAPTGTAPDIFLSGDTVDWHTNKGTGGGFTENGALTDGGNVVKAGIGNYRDYVMGLSPIVYYRMNDSGDGFDSVLSDETGTLNGIYKDGVALGRPGGPADPFDTSAYFGGGDNTEWADQGPDQLAQVGDNAIFDTAAGTVTAWFKATEFTEGGASALMNTVFSKEGSGNIDGQFYLGVKEGNVYGRVQQDGGDDYIDIDIAATAFGEDVQLGRWYMLTLAYGAGGADIYLNDTLVGNYARLTRTDSNRSFLIGAQNAYAGYANTVGMFIGSIDEVAWLPTKMNGAEVLALYNQRVFDGCSNPERLWGSMIYNTTSDVMQYCNGTDWVPMGIVPGAGGGGCSNPVRDTGFMIFNNTENVMQYCDGTDWIQVGRNKENLVWSLDADGTPAGTGGCAETVNGVVGVVNGSPDCDQTTGASSGEGARFAQAGTGTENIVWNLASDPIGNQPYWYELTLFITSFSNTAPQTPGIIDLRGVGTRLEPRIGLLETTNDLQISCNHNGSSYTEIFSSSALSLSTLYTIWVHNNGVTNTIRICDGSTIVETLSCTSGGALVLDDRVLVGNGNINAGGYDYTIDDIKIYTGRHDPPC